MFRGVFRRVAQKLRADVHDQRTSLCWLDDGLLAVVQRDTQAETRYEFDTQIAGQTREQGVSATRHAPATVLDSAVAANDLSRSHS